MGLAGRAVLFYGCLQFCENCQFFSFFATRDTEVSCPFTLAKKFVEAAYTLQCDIVKGSAHFTDPNGEFNFVQCAKGDCAGIHHVLQELHEAVGKFFDAQEVVKGQHFEESYQYYVDVNDVIAWGRLWFAISTLA